MISPEEHDKLAKLIGEAQDEALRKAYADFDAEVKRRAAGERALRRRIRWVCALCIFSLFVIVPFDAWAIAINHAHHHTLAASIEAFLASVLATLSIRYLWKWLRY